MQLRRDGNNFEIQCDSEIESVKFLTVVLAVEALSIESFFPSASAILSDLDSLATHLKRNHQVVQLGKGIGAADNAL